MSEPTTLAYLAGVIDSDGYDPRPAMVTLADEIRALNVRGRDA